MRVWEDRTVSDPGAPEKLSLGRVVGDVLRIGRRRFGVLIGAGVLIFVPLGLIDVLDERFHEPFSDLDLGDIEFGWVAALIGATFAHAAVALGGEVLYTGIVAASVVAEREGREHGLRHLVRTLPYGRLIAADLLLALVVAVGLVLFVIPGLILIARFALVAPAIEIERRPVIDAFRRSSALVRGSSGRMLLLVLPVLAVGDALTSALQSGVLFAIGDTFVGDWMIAAGADLLTAPLYALAVVVAFLELGGGAKLSTCRAGG